LRFVSNSAKLLLGNYRNAEEAMGNSQTAVIDGRSRQVEGQRYTVREAIPIQFSQGGLLQTDVDAALKHWSKWPGLTMEEDEMTPSSPIERIGVFDTVEWQDKYGLDDADRAEVEKLLLGNPANGVHYIKVDEVRAAIPWPTYNETHHNKIPVLAEELGCIDQVLAYERENKNRASVVAAVEERLPKTEQPVGEVIHA
jgi:hypothetical protein